MAAPSVRLVEIRIQVSAMFKLFAALHRKWAWLALAVVLIIIASVPPLAAQVKTPDELVTEARAAGDARNHQDAVKLFEQALAQAPARRGEWLREFADQIAYSGDPARAVSLYREFLSLSDVPQPERERAERGFAFALLWSGQADAAVQALTALVARTPADEEATTALADAQRTLFAAGSSSPPDAASPSSSQVQSSRPPDTNWPAREKASSARELVAKGENREAAAAFAEALALDAGLLAEIGREYADQVTYAGDPAAGADIYKRVLDLSGLSEGERALTRRGRAFALLWSGQSEAAADAFTGVVAAAPGDAEAVKALADARAASAQAQAGKSAQPSAKAVSSAPRPAAPPPPSPGMKKALEARAAAGKGENARAAGLFAEALRLEPTLFSEFGVEYADQIAYAGDPARSVFLYRRIQRTAGLPKRKQAELGRKLAFAYLWSNQFSAAVSAWEPIFRARPRDREARTALADALVGLARSEAAVPRNAEAARLFERAFVIDRPRRRGLLREYADQVLYSGAAGASIPLYQELLAKADVTADERQQGLLGLARGHAWSGDHRSAVPVYTDLLATWPQDVNARIGRGQSLNSLAYHERALADFESALQVAPGNEEAMRGAAQSETSLGRHRASLARLGGLLAAPSPDRRTLIIAANARRSIGRPDQAAAIARQMLAASPTDAEAQGLLDQVMRERRPLTKFDGEVISRSDDLSIATIAASHEVFANAGLTSFGAQARFGTYRGGEFPAYDLASAGVLARHRLNDWLEARTSALINQESGEGDDELRFTHDTALSFHLSDTWKIDAQAIRRYADENPEVFEQDVLADDVGGAIFFTPWRDIRGTLRGYFSDYGDGNQRAWGQADAAYNVLETGNLWLGARATAFEFQEDFDNGYWNPVSYQSVHGTFHAFGSPAPGWWADAQGALGYAWSEKDGNGITGSIEGRISREITPSSALEMKVLYQYSAARSNEAPGAEPSDEPFQRGVVGLQFRHRW
jgi:tetratricopeptide (TPR) repeat protein